MNDKPRGYEELNEFAREHGYPVKALLALGPQNDPFYSGSPGNRVWAEWFAKLWRQFKCPRGTHLRRFHYVLISQKVPVKLPDGKPYRNTDRCWQKLLMASRPARHQGLVDPTSVDDHRNPDPHLFAHYGLVDPYGREPGVTFGEARYWPLPSLYLSGPDSFELPDITAHGYDYGLVDQPYHLEVWIEKSTMNDVLEPVCQARGVNLVTGVGFQSISNVIVLLHRLAALPDDKPTRLFYIADFDPAGDSSRPAAGRAGRPRTPQPQPAAALGRRD
jgi:hypothetical protein